MANKIESFLFAGGGAQAVIEFTQRQNSILLSFAPWESLGIAKKVMFNQAKVISVDVYADDDDDLNLPWDIIGFDCYELAGNRWRFVLHCGGIEYSFESEWPTLIEY
jgi:hypothetical protein